MDDNLMLLVLTKKTPQKEKRLRFIFDRQEELRLISEAGAKIRHDSGGRLIIIEVTPGVEKILLEQIPDARLVPVDTNVSELIGDLDNTESLFLEALKIRASESYREDKRKRKFGESPEEKKLTTGSCIKGY